MNNKLIYGVVILVILAGGAYILLNKSNSYQLNSQKQMQPAQNQSNQANPATSAPAMTPNTVKISNFNFSPASLTVKVGDKVTWTNGDSVGHSATADDGSFDTGVFASGQSGSVTFSKTGTFAYHCSVHPNMKGTIVVQ